MVDPEGIEVKVDGNKISVVGIDKEKLVSMQCRDQEKREHRTYKGKYQVC